MNERIKELIEQATSTQGPTPYNPLTFEVFDKEKFAEFIVREAHEIIVIGGVDDIDDVLKHFGIEE